MIEKGKRSSAECPVIPPQQEKLCNHSKVPLWFICGEHQRWPHSGKHYTADGTHVAYVLRVCVSKRLWPFSTITEECHFLIHLIWFKEALKPGFLVQQRHGWKKRPLRDQFVILSAGEPLNGVAVHLGNSPYGLLMFLPFFESVRNTGTINTPCTNGSSKQPQTNLISLAVKCANSSSPRHLSSFSGAAELIMVPVLCQDV